MTTPTTDLDQLARAGGFATDMQLGRQVASTLVDVMADVMVDDICVHKPIDRARIIDRAYAPVTAVWERERYEHTGVYLCTVVGALDSMLDVLIAALRARTTV